MDKHGSHVLSKFNTGMQYLVSSVELKDELPPCPEDATIEEASNINIAWLIDIEELDIVDFNKAALAIN